MIRYREIQQSFKTLVGWSQHFDPSKKIDEELTISDSGLIFQNAHPLMTLDNVAAIMPDNFGVQYPTWNEAENYQVGAIVNSSGEVWQALQANTNNPPSYNSPFWKKYSLLSAYLEDIMKQGAAQVVQTFVKMKQLQEETKSLLERRMLFDGAGRIKATVQNRGKLVGFEITPIRSMGVTAKVEKIGLQMAGAVGVVKVYLFHSSQSAPVMVKDLDFTVTNGGFQWFIMSDMYLPYIGSNNAGGSWYICYNQEELPFGMEAVNFSKDWSREPCGSCNSGDLAQWREITKYLQVSPFAAVPELGFKEQPQLWDIGLNGYTNTQNYGLNCEISVGCDLTDFIVSQRQLFSSVLQQQVAAIVLRELALNPNVRVNRNQSNASRSDILYELDGNTNGVRPGGLGYELKKSYEALSLDTRGLDRICLQCNNRGVKYRTV